MANWRKHGTGRKTGKIAGLLYALVVLIFLMTLAVVLTLNFRWIYYRDITWMKLEEVSGMNPQVIRANYDALIDYNLLWHRGALVFPTLPMSESARIHFAEVKQIFDGIQAACVISGLVSVCILISTRRKRRWWLKITGILGFAVPGVLGFLVAAGWERFFVTFHEMVFSNDYWLFDPAADPVILILPDGYFLQCAVLILVLVFIGSLLSISASGKRRK